MKRIGINTLFLIPHKVGGTEFYARSVIAALEKYDTENTYIVFCNHENASSFSFTSPRWKKVVCPISAQQRVARILFEQLIFPSYIQKENLDVLHSLGYVGPLLCSASRVTTVHDANWLDVPHDISWASRLIQVVLMPACLGTSVVICTDSEFSRSRIEKHFPWVSKKIVVVSPWVSNSFLMRLKRNEKKTRKKFLLCVSAFYPHKNILYLLDLFVAFQKKDPSYNLVIVGDNGSDKEAVEKRIASMKNVIHHVRVSTEVLTTLYQTASVFIFPSTYEGFGYPVYEAAATGMKIIVGRREMYDRQIQGRLNQLTFHLDSDVPLLMDVVRERTKPQQHVVHTEKESINKLISIYTSL